MGFKKNFYLGQEQKQNCYIYVPVSTRVKRNTDFESTTKADIFENT